MLEIARGNRPDLFNFNFKKPKPFVPRHLRLELTERTDADGRVLTPAATTELPEILELFKHNEVEAVAVCFLHAYANPANELATLEAIRGLWPDVTVVGSHAITREWREYERTSTTVLSAYVKPVAAHYLHALASKLSERGTAVAPFIMQSNGGIGTIDAACENPISMVESGPASGVLGAIELGRLFERAPYRESRHRRHDGQVRARKRAAGAGNDRVLHREDTDDRRLSHQDPRHRARRDRKRRRKHRPDRRRR